MTIGEKIKALRKEKHMTQAQVAGDKITRNMMCLIEKDNVHPSLDTLMHIANALGVNVAYLLDEENDRFFYEKQRSIQKIRALFKSRNYSACKEAIETLHEMDDETAWIASICAIEVGIECIRHGNLTKAMHHLTQAQKYVQRTCYPTEALRARIALYLPVAENIQSPLLEFDEPTYRMLCEEGCHTEFYKYITQDLSYDFKNTRYADHMKAKELIRERKYADAKDILHGIENTRSQTDYDAVLFFGIYTDLELCYKELYDFEQAYRYANKRMSLLASFRS